jgi:ferredoxin
MGRSHRGRARGALGESFQAAASTGSPYAKMFDPFEALVFQFTATREITMKRYFVEVKRGTLRKIVSIYATEEDTEEDVKSMAEKTFMRAFCSLFGDYSGTGTEHQNIMSVETVPPTARHAMIWGDFVEGEVDVEGDSPDQCFDGIEINLDKCIMCGCTEDHACEEGCYWILPGLCSVCAEKMMAFTLSKISIDIPGLDITINDLSKMAVRAMFTPPVDGPAKDPIFSGSRHTRQEMEYLVRFQIQKWSYEQIADYYKVSLERVKQVCNEISDILGMTLRDDNGHPTA